MLHQKLFFLPKNYFTKKIYQQFLLTKNLLRQKLFFTKKLSYKQKITNNFSSLNKLLQINNSNCDFSKTQILTKLKLKMRQLKILNPNFEKTHKLKNKIMW